MHCHISIWQGVCDPFFIISIILIEKVEPAVNMYNSKKHLVQESHFSDCLLKKEQNLHPSLAIILYLICYFNRCYGQCVHPSPPIILYLICYFNRFNGQCHLATKEATKSKNLFIFFFFFFDRRCFSKIISWTFEIFMQFDSI